MAELLLKSATQLVLEYRSGETSPVDVAKESITQIERLDGIVNGFSHVDHETTLRQARASEERWHRRKPLGPIDGVPVSVKDLVLTEGWPTLRGSKSTPTNGEWLIDAPSVASLRRHGAVLTGKTTTPEFGWKGVTDSLLTGVTRNPWNPSLTAGGSSGGSATAVALGMSALSVGTDGGGSIRIPSSFCGIVGLKPTYGRVAQWPSSPFGTLAHTGPMTRTVEDAVLLYRTISGPDPRDPTSLPDTTLTENKTEDGINDVRVAYSANLGYVDVDPEVAQLVRAAVQTLSDLGANVEEADPGFTDPKNAFEKHWYAGAAMAVSGGLQSALDPGLVEIAEEAKKYRPTDYQQAAYERADLARIMDNFHTRYDVLITPTLPIVAFSAGVEVPPSWPYQRWHTWTPFTYPFNLTGQPAITIPCGVTSNGLPVGLQIVAARFAESTLMRVASRYEQAAPFDHTPLRRGIGPF